MSHGSTDSRVRGLIGYGAALASIAIALLLYRLLEPHLGEGQAPYITLFPAVVFVSIRFGLGPGLLATALGALTAVLFILSPQGRLELQSTAAAVTTAVFSAMGIFLSILAERNRRLRLNLAAGEQELALHRSMEALREKEERYQALFDTMTEGFALHEIITDEQGRPCDYRFLEVNPAFERLSGMKREDVLGKRVLEILPGIEPYWIEEYGKVALTGEATHIENFAARLNRWFEVFAYRPAPGRFAVVFSDITRRKQAETALSQSQKDLDRAQAVGQIGSWRLDVGRNVLTWSDENHRIFGIPKGTPLTYETFLEIIHPDDREYVDTKWKAGLAGEPYDVEHRICADGRVKWVREKAHLEFDPAGGLQGGFGTTQDITERKHAEEALRRMNETLELRVAERTNELLKSVAQVQAERRRFHEVLDALPVYVALLTPDYHIPFANKFFESRFGKNDGRCCYQCLFQRAEPCENCQTFNALEANKSHRWEWAGPDGQQYDVHDFPFEDIDGSRMIMEVGLDITERRRSERSLIERTAEVQRLADQLRALAADLSRVEQRERKRLSKVLHDHVQQLLVAARIQVSFLKRDSNPERIRAAAQGVDGILREALDASRSLTVELSPPVLDQKGLNGALAWLASRTLEKHQFKVILRADNRAEPADEETRILLFECARELLFNAVKHAGVAEAYVALLRTKENSIKLMIRDEGRGFDADLLKKRRADEATFGLFSIQQRLAHIGGEMEIVTCPDRGTRISITVPQQPAPGAELPETDAGRRDPATRLKVLDRAAAHRVLVVDDHKIMREGLAELLQIEPDIEIVGQAADGPQAIELADRLQPDVIIMDINLSEMSGVEATRRILAKNPRIKVIGLSMHAQADLAGAMREAGASAYLSKGGPAEDLVAAIRQICAVQKIGIPLNFQEMS